MVEWLAGRVDQHTRETGRASRAHEGGERYHFFKKISKFDTDKTVLFGDKLVCH